MTDMILDDDYLRRIATEATERDQERRARLASRATGDERWYLAGKAASFSEEKATKMFDEYGFGYYAPKLRVLVPIPMNRLPPKKRRGIPQYEAKLIPMFSTYRLLHFDLRRNDWRDLFERVRICGIVCSREGGRALPRAIDQAEIDKLRAKEVDGAIPETVTVQEIEWKAGEEARVVSGPYAGHKGIVHKLPDGPISALDESSRVQLAMSMFGRVTLVELSLAHIEKF